MGGREADNVVQLKFPEEKIYDKHHRKTNTSCRKKKKSSLRLNLIKKFRATPAILTKRCTEHDFSFFKNFKSRTMTG